MRQGDSFRCSTSEESTRSGPAQGPPDQRALPTHAGPQSRQEFDEYSEAYVRCYPAARRAAQATLQKALPKGFDEEVLAGEAAFDYMVALRQAIVEAVIEIASAYDSGTWLRLIRRLSPHAVEFVETGSTDHEGDALQRIAENLVGTASGARIDSVSEKLPTEVSMRLARLMAHVRLVDELEGDVRCSTKGVKYIVAPRRRPRPYDSNALLDALYEFDLRNKWGSVDGAARLQEINPDDFRGDPPMLVAYRFNHGLAIDQSWHGGFALARVREEPVQFTVRAFETADETYTTLGRGGVLQSYEDPQSIASIVVFGHALLRYALSEISEVGQTLPHLGMVEIESETLLTEIADALRMPQIAEWLTLGGQASITAERVIDCVLELYEHGSRSYPGPVIQSFEGRTIVDVWAYAWHVSHDLKLSPHTGGAIANLSAEEFEIATQSLIDASVLAPPAELRRLRGRTLRLNGKPVTDVDAVLTHGRTVFLISCKKFMRKVDYLAGEYVAARNGTSRLDAALDEWRHRIGTLREWPEGDNYDLTGYDIQGFILLPELIFTPRDDARELLPFGRSGLFFTKVESFGQFSATLEMAGWPEESPPVA